MAVLDKSSITDVHDQQVTGPISVPEWGGDVHVRSMDGKELDEWQENMYLRVKGAPDGEMKSVRGIAAFLLVRTLSDAKGERLFGSSKEDLDIIISKNGEVLETLRDIAMEFNGLKPDNEEVEKNSEATPSASGGSD